MADGCDPGAGCNVANMRVLVRASAVTSPEGPLFCAAARGPNCPVPRKSRNVIGLCQVRRLRCYGPVERGAGIAVERKRGPERFLFGDLTSEAIKGGRRSLVRLISGRIPK